MPGEIPSLKFTSQSLGLSVHFPEGQSSAPWAEHSESQLRPFPQVTSIVFLVSRKQHVTVLMFSALENASSKASMEVELVFSSLGTIAIVMVGPVVMALKADSVWVSVFIIPHSFNDIVVFTCDKVRG